MNTDMRVCLVVETTAGELLSIAGRHVLLARRLRRIFAAQLRRGVRIRNAYDETVWEEG